jgi:adenylate kinase family enzyme
MAGWRIHITGASGSGTTTLGRVLAGELAVPHHDTDDYYWLPTVPPYATARPAGERLRLMQAMFAPRPAWVLSGSLGGWADPLVPRFDLVVFLRTATETRLDRLHAREVRRYGAAAIAPGGDRHREVEAFLDWASRYEHGDREGRTLQGHEAWLAALPCPVLRLDGGRPTAELAAAVMGALRPGRVTAPDPGAISLEPTDHGVPPA